MTNFRIVILFLAVSLLLKDITPQTKIMKENYPVLNTASKVASYQTAALREVFYDQTQGSTSNGYASQDFEAIYDTFDCQAADDFPAPGGGIISGVVVIGSYNTGGPAEGFNVYFFADSGGVPGEQVYYAYNQPYTFDGQNLFTIPLDPHAVLPPGHYWVSVQCRMDFSSGGQWYWHQVTGSYWNTAQWQNPGGAWLTGCTTWGSIQSCVGAWDTDMAFALNCVTIPVELITFKASSNYGDVILEWSTATETNNRGFEIQRKGTNNIWTDIAFIEGYGTTAQKHNYSYTDKTTEPGIYYYRLQQVDLDGKCRYSEVIEADAAYVLSFELEQNYPNPFNPATKIGWQVPSDCRQILKVYDALGREIATLVDEFRIAGQYEVEWNGESLPGGVYFCRLQAGDKVRTKKMTLLK